MRRRKAPASRLALAAAVGAVLAGVQASPAIALTATAVPFTAVEGGGIRTTVATFTEGLALTGCSELQYQARITWGDATSTAATVSATPPTLLGPCLYAVDGAHTYAEEGPVDYSVTIAGRASSGDTGPIALTVQDAPLSIRTGGFTANQGAPAAATLATFTDANPGALPADFGATIAWGDGTSSAGAVTAGPRGDFAVTATHTYAHSGAFDVSVAIRDAGGSGATAGATADVAIAQPPTAIPPGGSPPPPLRLGLSNPVLARGGTVVVGVRCPVAAKLCRGRLNVATVAAPHSRLVALRGARILGATLFIVPGGRRAELSVRPKRAVVALLRRAGSVKVAAYASSFDAATGRSQVASLIAKLRLTPRGRR